jgi:hypothetical protein
LREGLLVLSCSELISEKDFHTFFFGIGFKILKCKSTMADAWEAFGSDSDDSGDDHQDGDGSKTSAPSTDSIVAEAVALFLAQSLLKLGGLVERRVAIWEMKDLQDADGPLASSTGTVDISVWKAAVQARGINVITDADNDVDVDASKACIYDVILGISANEDEKDAARAVPKAFLERAWRSLVPGGSLLMALGGATDTSSLLSDLLGAQDSFYKSNGDVIHTSGHCKVFKITKLPCRIQEATCPWLSSNHDLQLERQRVAQATVTLSSAEIRSRQLTDATIRLAVQAMQQTGFCILPQLLDPVQCLQWGDAVKEDFHAAAEILLRDEQVDLYHPGESKQEPGVYRELSMREDLRLDLRSGPALRKLRSGTSTTTTTTTPSGNDGNLPWTIRADTPLDHHTEFLRGHADLLQIIRRVMHPVDSTLSPGNFGRYNFDGRGPDGSFPDLRVGPVGGILSLPGSADQAMHADTPHLFEHLAALPAHYINIFTPGSASGDHVGQTAVVPKSHRLDVTAEYAQEPETSRPVWWKDLVRPRLELGDVLIFDCRILHFGLANTSADIERPLLYTNMTQHWFHDPKNWDDHRPIFPSNSDD